MRTLHFLFDVVSTYVPLLVGLDLITEKKILINVSDTVIMMNGIGIPLQRESGHLILDWRCDVFYTRAELKKLHKQFKNPSAGKLCSLLKKVTLCDVDQETRNVLSDVLKQCSTCSEVLLRNLLFKVGSISTDDLIFNRVVSIDLMKIEKETVLHVIDVDTRFSVATFLTVENTDLICNAFLLCWGECRMSLRLIKARRLHLRNVRSLQRRTEFV